jgi:membrane protein implicated in regulation of membrane protease activity
MFTWLASLDALGILFVCVALPASIIFLIQLIMTFVGLGGDHGDIGGGADNGIEGVFGEDDPTMPDQVAFNCGAPIHLFSFRGVIAFLMAFGWVGLAVQAGGLPWWACLLIAFAAGMVMMTVVAVVLQALFRLQSDGTMNIRNAVGLTGTVYLTVPAKRGGTGKVNLILQGSYCELDAVTDSEEPLKTGTEVTVRTVTGGNTLVVSPRA